VPIVKQTPIPEGVTRFTANHTKAPLDAGRLDDTIDLLVAWRTILAELSLIGREPVLYDGVGYGNVSARLGPYPGSRGRRPFVITGTQTSGKLCVDIDDFAIVNAYDWRKNKVTSEGLCRPSSESMTHGSIYDLGGQIRFVFHAHCPIIWQNAATLRIPTTREEVIYGTPEMASEIVRLAQEDRLWETQILTMAGHEDGVVSFGRSAEEAGNLMINALAKAYTARFGKSGQLCRR